MDNDLLGTSLNDFFGAWADLANPTVEGNLKYEVFAKAQSLVTTFHSIDESLKDLESNLNHTIEAEIENLNRLLTAVADMNKQILTAEAGGNEANDLRDQRDLLISQVAEIARVSVVERSDGTQDVILAGRTMVARDSVTLFQTSYQTTDDGTQMVVLTQENFSEVTLSEGKLEGLLTARDQHIAEVREHLDTVAAKLIEEVNSLHVQGRTATSSGLAFFTGDSMSTIGINPAIIENQALIATGRTATVGDLELAAEIADLASVGLGGSGDESVSDRYRAMLIDVASRRSSYEFMVENQDNVVAALETKISSISGVSLDEEGANMVKYQNSYNAAAKVITTVQEMYDALLTMV